MNFLRRHLRSPWVRKAYRQARRFTIRVLSSLGIRAGPQPDFASELDFWDTELSLKGLYSEDILARVNPEQQSKVYPWNVQPYVDLLHQRLGRPPRVLDVGSGPISMWAHGANQGWIDLVSADPLANDYLELLNKYRYAPNLVLLQCFGEQLTKAFGPAAFDLVWMYNALDHSQSPKKVVAELVNVLKPEGYLIIQGNAREGSSAAWTGLHQHDLYAAPGGRLMCETWQGPADGPSAPYCLTDRQPLTLVESSEPTDARKAWVRLVWKKN